jgi:hypothetical protein
MSILFCCCFSTHRRRIEKLKTSLDTRHRDWWMRTLTSTIARVYKVYFEKKDVSNSVPHLLGRLCLFRVLRYTARDQSLRYRYYATHPTRSSLEGIVLRAQHSRTHSTSMMTTTTTRTVTTWSNNDSFARLPVSPGTCMGVPLTALLYELWSLWYEQLW